MKNILKYNYIPNIEHFICYRKCHNSFPLKICNYLDFEDLFIFMEVPKSINYKPKYISGNCMLKYPWNVNYKIIDSFFKS